MNVAQFITALGGTKKTAELFGVGETAVSNWRVWNRLPQRLHLRALREASARGLVFDPESAERASPRQSRGTSASA